MNVLLGTYLFGARLRRWRLIGRLIAYGIVFFVVVLLMIASVLMTPFINADIKRNEANTIKRLEELNSALAAYQATYQQGYPAGLFNRFNVADVNSLLPSCRIAQSRRTAFRAHLCPASLVLDAGYIVSLQDKPSFAGSKYFDTTMVPQTQASPAGYFYSISGLLYFEPEQGFRSSSSSLMVD